MPRGLELRDLRALVVVADEGSIRRAAARLHLSQPPLSRQLQALERLVGADLFVRTTSGVALTPAGERILVDARAVLRAAEALLANARQRQPSPLRVGISMGAPLALAERLLPPWERACGARPLHSRSDYSPALARALREGGLDVALLSLPGDVAGLEVRVLAREPMVAAVPAQHAAARRRAISMRHLGELPLFWYPRSHNPHFHAWCERAFREIGYRPRYLTVEPGYPFTLERIGQGHGFTLLNGWRTRTRTPGVVYRRLLEGQRLCIELALGWKAGCEPPEAAALLKAAKRVVARGPGP